MTISATRQNGLIHLFIPDYFNIQYLPDDLKQLAEGRLHELRARLVEEGVAADLQQIDSILSYPGTGDFSPHLMNEFKPVTKIDDRLRNESITKLVPELRLLMEYLGGSGSTHGWFSLMISRGKWLTARIKNQFLG